MTKEELKKILENHKHWINKDCEGWGVMRADLSGADLRYADLRGADLRYAGLRYAGLSGADLSGADLSGADLRYADLRGANLRYADLRGADLRGADLSDAKNYLSAIDFLKEKFEFTSNGIIAYKTFGSMYNPPKKWIIQSGAIITENCNPNRSDICGCGINVAPLQWVKRNYVGDIWKVLKKKWKLLPEIFTLQLTMDHMVVPVWLLKHFRI